MSSSTSWHIFKLQLLLCDFLCPSFFPAATITWKCFCCFLREIQGRLLPCLCPYLLFVSLHQEWLKNGFLFIIISKNWAVFHVFVDNFVLVLEGKLQYSCLENPMDGGAWWAAVHGVARSRTRLSDFTFTFHFHAVEKEMAPYSSVHAWRIPGTGEPGGLPSMGSHRVGHDWSDLAAAIFPSSVWDSTVLLIACAVISCF